MIDVETFLLNNRLPLRLRIDRFDLFKVGPFWNSSQFYCSASSAFCVGSIWIPLHVPSVGLLMALEVVLLILGVVGAQSFLVGRIVFGLDCAHPRSIGLHIPTRARSYLFRISASFLGFFDFYPIQILKTVIVHVFFKPGCISSVIRFVPLGQALLTVATQPVRIYRRFVESVSRFVGIAVRAPLQEVARG